MNEKSDKVDIEALLKRAEQHAESVAPALEALLRSIVAAAVCCRDGMKPTIRQAEDRAPLEQEAYIYFEFLYLFVSLFVRQAVSVLPQHVLAEVTQNLVHFSAKIGIGTYFHHWEADRKERMEEQFREALSNRATEYGEIEFDLSNPMTFEGFEQAAQEVVILAAQQNNWEHIEGPITKMIALGWAYVGSTDKMASISPLTH